MTHPHPSQPPRTPPAITVDTVDPFMRLGKEERLAALTGMRAEYIAAGWDDCADDLDKAIRGWWLWKRLGASVVVASACTTVAGLGLLAAWALS